LRLLVSSLRLVPLDELIGALPEAWEARNQPVSRDLLKGIETEMVSRARKGLPADINHFFERLAVFRQPVDRYALESVSEGVESIASWRDDYCGGFCWNIGAASTTCIRCCARRC